MASSVRNCRPRGGKRFSLTRCWKYWGSKLLYSWEDSYCMALFNWPSAVILSHFFDSFAVCIVPSESLPCTVNVQFHSLIKTKLYYFRSMQRTVLRWRKNKFCVFITNEIKLQSVSITLLAVIPKRNIPQALREILEASKYRISFQFSCSAILVLDFRID